MVRFIKEFESKLICLKFYIFSSSISERTVSVSDFKGQLAKYTDFMNASKVYDTWLRTNIQQLTEQEFNSIFLKKYRNPSEKSAFFADESNLIVLNELCQCENLKFHEVLFRYPMGMEVHCADNIFDLIEETLLLITPFGIPQHSLEIHKWKWQGKFDPEQKEPEIFSLDSLSFGFFIWLGACGLSCLWFLIELMQKMIRKQL